MSSVAPNSPRQTAASVNAPTVPTIIMDGFTNSDQDDSNSNQNDSSEQIIEKISNLQDLEGKKYDDLNILLASNPTPDNIAKQKQLMNDIAQLTSIRSSLFNTLLQYTKNNMKVNNVMNASVQDKHTIITLKENDLNARRSAIAALNQNVENTQRMVDINVYYKKQYEVRVKIMKYIVILCLLIIFFVVLMNLGWLPKEMVTVLVIIIILVGGSYIGSLVYDTYQRSNINYDEYDWGFDANKMDSTISKQPKVHKKRSNDRTCKTDKTVRESLNDVCPLNGSETRNGVVYINPTNLATRDDYLFSGCTDANTCDNTSTSNVDPVSKNLLDNVKGICGSWGVGDYNWDNGVKKWIKNKSVESFMLPKVPKKYFSKENETTHMTPFTVEDNYGII